MSDSIRIAGRDITPKPLDMAQVREFLDAMEKEAKDENSVPHIVDVLFNDEVPAKAVSISTGLSMDELGGKISQEDMRALLDKVRAVNPTFVGMMERFIKARQADA